MTKNEYMESLKNALRGFEKEIADEIISDYEEHFEMGAINNKTEEQICDELGSINNLVSELRELSAQSPAGTSSSEAVVNYEVPAETGEGKENNNDLGNGFDSVVSDKNILLDDLNKEVISLNQGQTENECGGREQESVIAGAFGTEQGAGTEQGGAGSNAGGFEDDGSDGGRGYYYNNDWSSFESAVNGMGDSISRGVDSIMRGVSDLLKDVADTVDITVGKNGKTYNYKTKGGRKFNVYFTGGRDRDSVKDDADTDGFDCEAGGNEQPKTEYSCSSDSGNTKTSCDTVIVNALCADVVVKESQDNRITMTYNNYGSKNQQLAYRFSHRQSGNVVYADVIKQSSHTPFFSNIVSPDIELLITLPANMKLLTIRATSGDIKFSDISVNKVEVNTASGDIRGRDLISDNAALTTLSGDIELQNITGSQLLTNSTSGEINVSNINVRSLREYSTSGDIALSNSGVDISELSSASGDVVCKTVQGESVAANSSSGDVSIAGVFRRISATSASGDISVNNNGSCEGHMKSISGDVTCSLHGSRGFSADVRTCSGDIVLCCGPDRRANLRNGAYTLGGGESRLRLSSTSGDIKVQS